MLKMLRKYYAVALTITTTAAIKYFRNCMHLIASLITLE
jgi:hypothetical protein